MGGTTRVVVKVPANLHGKVIGRGAATLKDIESDYGVKMTMPQRGSGSEDVVIEGPTVGCEAAKNRVLDICGMAPDLTGGARARADKLYDEANKLYDKMRSAGSKAEKNKLRSAAESKRAEAEKANREAAQAIFKAKNLGYGNEQMDLHGLRVKEALQFVEERLVAVDGDLRSGALESLTIITGFGHHSDNGKAKIKPEVVKLLTERGYNFQEDEAGGQFIVHFPQGAGGGAKPAPAPASGGAPGAGGGSAAAAGAEKEKPGAGVGLLACFAACCVALFSSKKKDEPSAGGDTPRQAPPAEQEMSRQHVAQV